MEPKCTLCFKVYSSNANVPLMLRCGCTFCAPCLKTMAKPLQYNTSIQCPSCKMSTPYSPDVDMESQLPANIYYLGLLKAAELNLIVFPFTVSYEEMIQQRAPVQLQHQPATTPDGSSPLCDECGARKAGVHCVQCVGVYCSPCFTTVHGASLVMRKHKSVPMTQMLSTPPTCPTHHGEQLKYWCATDNVSVCTECLIAREHKGHDFISVGEKAELIREELEPLVTSSIETMTNMNTSLKTVEQQLRELSKVSSSRSKLLSSYFHLLHTSLQVRETALFETLTQATMSYATSLQDARLCLNSSLNQLKSVLHKTQSTLKDDFAVIRCHGDLQKQLSGKETLPQAIKVGDIQSITVNVDKLTTLDYISKVGGVSFDENNSPILMTATGDPWLTSDSDGIPHNKLFLPSPTVPPSRPSSVTGHHRLTVKPHLSLRARSASPRVMFQSREDTGGINQRIKSGRSLTPKMNHGRSPTPRTSGRHSQTPMVVSGRSQTPSGRSPTPRISSVQSSRRNTPTRQPRPLTPVSLKETVEVTVTHVESVGEVFVQNNQQSKHVQELMKELNTQQTLSPLQRDQVEEGALIAALFTDDNNWYRASIESVNMTTIAMVTVYYVDFGNSEDVPLDRLSVLPRHLSDIPPLCSRCSFKHIQPLPIKILEGVAPVGWTKKDKTGLEKILFSQPTVQMKVYEQTPVGVILVDFLISVDQQQLKSISEMLVDRKIAVWGRDKWVESSILPSMPLAQGDTIEVVIPVAENPSDFYIHPVSMGKELEMLTEQIQQCAEKCYLLRAPLPYMGMLCCTHYEADNMWYRARVIKLVDDTTVEVHFIDFGNEEKVLVSSLLTINSKLLKPRQQAIHCQLSQVCPLTGDKWSEEVSDYFNDYIGGRVLKLSVLGEGNPLSVELRGTSRHQTATISSHLVKENKAQFVSKTTIKNNNKAISHGPPPVIVQTAPQAIPTPSNDNVPLIPDPPKPLPLPAMGQVMQAKVVHVVSPSLFHIQPVQHDNQLLNQLAAIEDPPTPHKLHHGRLYLSHFGDQLWHRVFLDDIAESSSCHVTFIDFGNQATILSQDLREIPQSLYSHPPLALMCRLVGVAPVGGDWHEDTSMYFYQLLQEKTLTVTIVSHVTDVLMEVSLSLEGNDVTNTLINAGQATPTGHTHYLPPVPPSTDEFKAAVTVVTNEGVVYGHVRENAMQLKALNSHIQEVCQSCDQDKSLKLAVGQSCCARYQQDSWCRVTVKNVNNEEATVDVFFIDFGNIETLPLSECLNIVVDLQIPAQALPMRVVAMEKPTEDLVDKDITVLYKGPTASSNDSEPTVHLVEMKQ